MSYFTTNNYDNLLLIDQINEQKIVNLLRNRHQTEKQYTKLGERILLSINPNKILTLNSDEVKLKYIQEYKDNKKGIENEFKLGAHLFSLVNSIYFNLRRTQTDQLLVLFGHSGSGKSNNKKQILTYLKELRIENKKEVKLFEFESKFNFILNFFTHLHSPLNKDASKIMLYTEVQFDEFGRTVGVKLINYLLQTSKLTLNNNNESNYKIFYLLLQGLNEDEKLKYKLQQLEDYKLLQGSIIPNSKQLNLHFSLFKDSLKFIGLNNNYQNEIFNLLSLILNLGNLHFILEDQKLKPNHPQLLENCSNIIGLLEESLINLLCYKTKFINKEKCTLILNELQIIENRNALIQCLYQLLINWLIEFFNSKLSIEEPQNFIAILDGPGYEPNLNLYNYEHFSLHYTHERIQNYIQHHIFESNNKSFQEEQIDLPYINYMANLKTLQLMNKNSIGLIALMNKHANKIKGDISDFGMLSLFKKIHNENELLELDFQENQFSIQHYHQQLTYNALGFMDQNLDLTMNSDFVLVLGGYSEIFVNNSFIQGLFNSKPNNFNENKVIQIKRKPSVKKRKSLKIKKEEPLKVECLLNQVKLSLDDLIDVFDQSEFWLVYHFNLIHNQHLDIQFLNNQVNQYQLEAICKRKKVEYTICYKVEEFIQRYELIFIKLKINLNQVYNELAENFIEVLNFSEQDIKLGVNLIYLSEDCWLSLESQLIELESNPIMDLIDNKSLFTNDEELVFEDDCTLNLPDNSSQLKLVDYNEEPVKIKTSKVRSCWLFLTWVLTWWIPTLFLKYCGRMKVKEVRMAWREKVALFIIIMILCSISIVFIIGINPLMCPTKEIFSFEEVREFDPKIKPYVIVQGNVYDLKKLGDHHGELNSNLIKKYAGKDVSNLFPQPVSDLCQFIDGKDIDPSVALQNSSINALDVNERFHDHRYYTDNYNPNFFANTIKRMKLRMKKGYVAISPEEISKKSKKGYYWGIINGKIYDLDSYIRGNIFNLYPDEIKKPNGIDNEFLDPNLVKIFFDGSGRDLSNAFNKLYKGNLKAKERSIKCLSNLFFTGVVDDRNSIQCKFAQYILLALSIFLFLILFVKFLASLQLGSTPEPEENDQFVILNVPCYTEGEESLKKTIDSLACLKYDDKRKLLFIVCDGMVVGGGNDIPTPQIVLEILGNDFKSEPEALSFLSIGEGTKQHNMGKVYTGLYDCSGHLVPYIVISKVGKPTERNKPGNRGKRDSQLILMNFFNKIHYDHAMTPLELEIYYQIQNVIGVDPHYYEFVLMVDADTIVMPDSLNRLVSVMIHDTKIMGTCGETSLANEKDSWATMIQVYEYFMSHHLSKSFESLFGSVTCLPGCFSMYRLRTMEKNIPYLVSNVICKEYGENLVNTLHKKNLLQLGEDRYLTTLMLKHFPLNKMTFVADAQCLTRAPDTWHVLLSQRRRWINSTIHNLLELVFLPRLCGFCCFSMRFVVFIDLFSTIIMPATMGFLYYLIYRLITDTSNIPLVSLILIVAPYICQMIVFIIRKQWQHIGWMIVYLIALPIFSFFIPIYSFWHFDDFSWGNTRLVMGEKGKAKYITQEEKFFDPKTIPLKKWSEYELTIKKEEVEESLLEHEFQGSFIDASKPYAQDFSRTSFFSSEKSKLSLHPAEKSRMSFNPNEKSKTSLNPFETSMELKGNKMSKMYSVNDLPNNRAITPLPMHSSYSHSNANQYPKLDNIRFNSQFSFQPNLSQGTMSSANSTLNGIENDIIFHIKQILSGADLMSITKKQIREQLQSIFQLDMMPYKDFINNCIEAILQGQL